MNFPGDTIRITGLKVRGKHGVYDSEKVQAQEFMIDVVLELNTRQAALTDEVTNTVHYGELAKALRRTVAKNSVNLLETLASQLASMCLADTKVSAVTITVHKPKAAHKHEADDISVTIRRTREDMR